MKKQEIKIYSPISIYKGGILAIFKRMVKSIIENRELTWQLFLRDIKARYKQSLLGWLWIFLMPIITMGTFLLLNISGIIRIGEIPVPYPIFGLLGFSTWQLFSNGWLLLTGSIVSAGVLVTQINFPRETIIFSFIGQVLIDFLIRLALVLFVYFLYGLSPSIWVLLFPLFLLPIFLLTLGLGFLGSILNVIIRDTKDLIGIGLSFFLFLMPIMYAMPEKGFLSKFNRYNPIYFLISTPRDIIIMGTIKFPQEYFISSVIALLFFIFGWFVFYLSQTKLAERM